MTASTDSEEEPSTLALDLAVAQLRDRPVPRSVEIADAVLRRSLATPRRAELVRARGDRDWLRVSTLVLVATVRQHVDDHLEGGAVGRVVLDVDREGRLRALTVDLLVQYGHDILALGDRTRHLAAEAVALALGPPATGEDLVTLTVSHVHVSDVTVGDPHLVDPLDEQPTPPLPRADEQAGDQARDQARDQAPEAT